MSVVDVRDAFCLLPVPDGAVAALRGITLQVAPGERVVVHGPNGSGKTTLLRVIAGEQRLAAGRAVVAGLDLATTAHRVLARWRAHRLGWVDQHPERMLRPELSVLENVALQQRLGGTGHRAALERAAQALDRLGVGYLAARRPRDLSGGEAQRVAVCAALAHGPDLVLADEPSGELDADSAEQVYDTLAEAVRHAGAALVLVSHDPKAARVADRVVRIRDGRLSETWRPEGSEPGRPQELLVLDDRGWLRLPEALRAQVGADSAVRAAGVDRAILLTPASLDGSHARPSRPAPPSEPSQPAPDARTATGADPGAMASHPRGHVVTIRAVDKAYGERVVLRGLDLDVVAGRLLVVRGRSGAGKSTLLRILLGLERPDAGSVCLDGIDLATLDRSALAALRRRLVAVVTQDVSLAETADVRANLELARAVRGLPSDEEAATRRLDAVGMLALASREARMLSGGERQRVAVARALSLRPRLAVLDEPSARLDEAGCEALRDVLAAAAREGAAVIVATHDPVLVEAADDVLDLENVDEPVEATT